MVRVGRSNGKSRSAKVNVAGATIVGIVANMGQGCASFVHINGIGTCTIVNVEIMGTTLAGIQYTGADMHSAVGPKYKRYVALVGNRMPGMTRMTGLSRARSAGSSYCERAKQQQDGYNNGDAQEVKTHAFPLSTALVLEEQHIRLQS